MKRKEFNKVVADVLADEKASYAEHLEILEILKKVNGKAITEKVFSKEVTGGKFQLKWQYGMVFIVGKYSHYLCYVTDNHVVDWTTFRERDVCYSIGAEERIKKLEELDMDKAFALFKQVDKHFKALVSAFRDVEREYFDSYYFPAFSNVLKFIYPVNDPDFDLNSVMSIARRGGGIDG